MRVALDTNILVYAEGVNGLFMKKAVLEILDQIPAEGTFIPVQVLGELFNVLVRKAKKTPEHAQEAMLKWQDTFPLVETSPAILFAAADLASHHNFSIWDSVVFSAAAAAGCRLLLSQDMQEGFTWSGVTVTNPFSPTKHSLLTALLES
ncbi:MAG: PIN domain-containing protein [Candidatus Sulfotelmatobacter sp.]